MFPVIDKKLTGCRLQFWMCVNGLTPKDIQQYLSLTCVQTVYRWLEGVNLPAIDNLYALSRLFHTRVDALIVGKENEGANRHGWNNRIYGYCELYCARRFLFQMLLPCSFIAISTAIGVIRFCCCPKSRSSFVVFFFRECATAVFNLLKCLIRLW